MVSAFSVPKATRQRKIPLVPGPGAYNAEKSRTIKPNDPQFSFARQSRMQISRMSPGPGSYNPHKQEKAPQYSILGRHNQFSQQYNICPGQYEPAKQFIQPKSPSYSILGKKDKKYEKSPGPGHYSSKSFVELGHGHDFGNGSRTKNIPFNTPGPGEYSYEEASIKYKSKQQPQYRFGSKFEEKQSNSPGPGQYNPKKEVFSKIGGMVSHHLRSAFLDPLTPGPGAYQTRLNTQQNKPKWSLPKQTRLEATKMSSIGPGHYNDVNSFKVADQKSPSYGFGNLQRLKMTITKMPGPGQYSPNYEISKKSIKIGEKMTINHDNQIPGPGAYQSNKYDRVYWLKGKGRYSQGKQKKFITKNALVPGPGAYATTSPMQLNSKRANFSKQLRMKLGKNDSPGPAKYEIKPTFADVPKYLL